jgi:hypothetical protein
LFFLLDIIQHEVEELVVALEHTGHWGEVRGWGGAATRDACLVVRQ